MKAHFYVVLCNFLKDMRVRSKYKMYDDCLRKYILLRAIKHSLFEQTKIFSQRRLLIFTLKGFELRHTLTIKADVTKLFLHPSSLVTAHHPAAGREDAQLQVCSRTSDEQSNKAAVCHFYLCYLTIYHRV